jgi:hypothetical protein
MTTGMEEVEAYLDPAIDVPPDIEPELVDILPRGYLSPSQVNMYLKCPRAWELAYIHRKPRRTSARMFQGIQVHQAIETVLKTRLETGILPSQATALDAYSDAFTETKALIDDWEGSDEGAVKDLGVKCTKAYYDEAAVDATPIEVEKTFHAVFKSPDGKIRLPILGRIDSIQVQTHTEQEYQDIREALSVKQPTKPKRVHDLKVVTDKWSEKDLKNDLQFAIYAGVEHVPDVQVDMVVKGRAKMPRPRYEKLAGVVSSRDVEHAKKVVLSVAYGIAAGVSTGNFQLADPSHWGCSPEWCGMWQYCRGKE